MLAILASCGENPGAGDQGGGGQTGGNATSDETTTNGGATTANGGATTANGGATTANGGTSSGGNSGTGGATTARSSSGGSAGNSAGTSDGGGSGGAGGTKKEPTGTGGSNSSSGCPVLTNATMAVHVRLNVTWPSTLGASSGSAEFHAWNMIKLSATGTSFTGKDIPCGSTVPDMTLASLVGGGKVAIEVPDSFWDTLSTLQVPTSGTISGCAPDSTFTSAGSPTLVGLTMTDPNASWPFSYTAITSVDVDGDGAPGLTALPKSASGYVNPPVSITGARADRLYVANRTQIDLKGTFTSCTEHSGEAKAKYFDNHVVGCHVAGGGDCTANQVKFEDDNRTAYTIAGGSYVAKIVADNASCSDVRNALP